MIVPVAHPTIHIRHWCGLSVFHGNCGVCDFEFQPDLPAIESIVPSAWACFRQLQGKRLFVPLDAARGLPFRRRCSSGVLKLRRTAAGCFALCGASGNSGGADGTPEYTPGVSAGGVSTSRGHSAAAGRCRNQRVADRVDPPFRAGYGAGSP